MGGNIFKDFACPIKRENIRPTLSAYIKHLGIVFPKKAEVFKNFEPVGSVGKKDVSGDLDLAIDFSHFFIGEDFNEQEMKDYSIEFDEWTSLYKKIKNKARTATDNMCKWKAFLKLIAYPIVREGMVHVANKKTTNGNLFTMFPQYDKYGQTSKCVQIDWMVGNLSWLRFAYHSAETGNLKGLHRTQLLVAMFSVKGYTFLHNKGVKEKGTNSYIVTTPEQAQELISNLYGQIKEQDIYEYKNLHSYLKSNATSEDYSKIIECYKRILTISKAKIPDDLQDEIDENTRLTWTTTLGS